jgi:hypothetical protein
MEAIEYEGIEVNRYRCPRCDGGMQLKNWQAEKG